MMQKWIVRHSLQERYNVLVERVDVDPYPRDDQREWFRERSRDNLFEQGIHAFETEHEAVLAGIDKVDAEIARLESMKRGLMRRYLVVLKKR